MGALLLEVILAAAIAPTIFDLPPLVASIVGVGIALILTFTSKYAVCAVLFRNCNVVQCHERFLRLGALSGAVSFVMLFPYYFARSTAETVLFADAALGVLSISLPFFAGSLMAAGLMADWPQRLTKAYEDVQARQRRLTLFQAEIKILLEEIEQ
jgi:hypothetical protein